MNTSATGGWLLWLTSIASFSMLAWYIWHRGNGGFVDGLPWIAGFAAAGGFTLRSLAMLRRRALHEACTSSRIAAFLFLGILLLGLTGVDEYRPEVDAEWLQFPLMAWVAAGCFLASLISVHLLRPLEDDDWPEDTWL